MAWIEVLKLGVVFAEIEPTKARTEAIQAARIILKRPKSVDTGATARESSERTPPPVVLGAAVPAR